MRVDEDTLRHVAKIARLNLTEEETKKFLPQMQEILDSFNKIDEVKADTKPSFQPVPLKNRLREDQEKECFTQEKALNNAKSKDGFIKGPKAV